MPVFTLRMAGWLLCGSCMAVPASQLTASPAAETLVIKHGGTYTGHYRSHDSDLPCIRIDTQEPVVLRQCRLEGPGTLIDARTNGANLTVVDCVGSGLPPTNDRTAPGHFLEANNARSVTVANCNLVQTAGIVIYGWRGDGSARQTIKILRNSVRNIDGRYRDGGGARVHFLLLNQVHGVENVEVAWNQVINEPDNSLVEDNINIYNSSGTANSPIRIHDNYIQGAYPFPATAPKFTGSGITTDGDATTLLAGTAYVEAYRNQLISTCNAAMNIAAGHDIRYHHNRMVTSSILPDGRQLAATYAATAIFDAYKRGKDLFFNNRVDHNLIGFRKPGYRIPLPDRHDLSTSNCATCPDNQHLPNPITYASEQTEWQLWQTRLDSARIKPGLRAAPVATRAVH